MTRITDGIKPKEHAIQNVYFKPHDDNNDDDGEEAMGDGRPFSNSARNTSLWTERDIGR